MREQQYGPRPLLTRIPISSEPLLRPRFLAHKPLQARQKCKYFIIQHQTLSVCPSACPQTNQCSTDKKHRFILSCRRVTNKGEAMPGSKRGGVEKSQRVLMHNEPPQLGKRLGSLPILPKSWPSNASSTSSVCQIPKISIALMSIRCVQPFARRARRDLQAPLGCRACGMQGRWREWTMP